jgi:cell division protein FtsW (lipid II flippase)
MPAVFQFESTVSLVVFFVLLVVKIYAFGSALLYSSASYEAAGKLTKVAWCVILGLGVALSFIPIGGLALILVSTIAALVYLLDVRPALAGLTRRR